MYIFILRAHKRKTENSDLLRWGGPPYGVKMPRLCSNDDRSLIIPNQISARILRQIHLTVARLPAVVNHCSPSVCVISRSSNQTTNQHATTLSRYTHEQRRRYLESLVADIQGLRTVEHRLIHELSRCKLQARAAVWRVEVGEGESVASRRGGVSRCRSVRKSPTCFPGPD